MKEILFCAQKLMLGVMLCWGLVTWTMCGSDWQDTVTSQTHVRVQLSSLVPLKWVDPAVAEFFKKTLGKRVFQFSSLHFTSVQSSSVQSSSVQFSLVQSSPVQ